MRDIKQLHPRLQTKVTELQELCQKNGITIGISECLRTVAEQDALYAKGRTKAGSIVTNAKGSTYSSMHQWGIAFDFYLKVDVDGDGKISDDAFNNSTKLFNKVGALGQSIGLEWGGSWRSFVDMPHFQLPDWGSTPTRLKQLYGTPDKFFATWSSQPTNTTNNVTSYTTTGVDYATNKDSKYSREYTTTANLNLRKGAGTNKDIIITIPRASKVRCWGYYSKVGGADWLYVTYGKYIGFVHSGYLR